jgi:hypothetical protein
VRRFDIMEFRLPCKAKDFLSEVAPFFVYRACKQIAGFWLSRFPFLGSDFYFNSLATG